MVLTQLEMVLRGEQNLRFKFHTMALSEISRRACLGTPRSVHSWSVESKLMDHFLVGEIKVDMEWRSLRFFFLTRDFAPTWWQLLCVRWEVCSHSVPHAHFSDTVSLRDVQTSRTRMAQGVCSAHVVSLHLTFSILMFHLPSLLFPDGHFETTFLPSTSSTSLPNFTRPESAVQARCRTPWSLATWPIPCTPQVSSANHSCWLLHRTVLHALCPSRDQS